MRPEHWSYSLGNHVKMSGIKVLMGEGRGRRLSGKSAQRELPPRPAPGKPPLTVQAQVTGQDEWQWLMWACTLAGPPRQKQPRCAQIISLMTLTFELHIIFIPYCPFNYTQPYKYKNNLIHRHVESAAGPDCLWATVCQPSLNNGSRPPSRASLPCPRAESQPHHFLPS